MRYNGGKKRVAKKIAGIIQRYDPGVYWEPFCGVASVGMHVSARLKFFSDIDESVVEVLRAATSGYEFPGELSEQEYRAAKLLSPDNPIHGFAKYGCSYAGKPWGGYARSGSRNYAKNAKNALCSYRGRDDLILMAGDYRSVHLPHDPDVIYCDPPYANTTRVGAGMKFDSGAFWEWARSLPCTVLVSEYAAPTGWVEIFSEEITDGLVPRGRRNTEKLFIRDLTPQPAPRIIDVYSPSPVLGVLPGGTGT